MRSAGFALAAVAMVGASAANAVEVAETVFQVSFKYAGSDHVLEDSVVPLLPDNACYHWYIRAGESVRPTEATETLTLPEPLEDWGTLDTDPTDGIDISADRKVAVRTFVPEFDGDGWFGHTWCVAAGDPVGSHSITIKVDEETLKSFEFVVVPPEDYYWPAIAQPTPRERSVDHSW